MDALDTQFRYVRSLRQAEERVTVGVEVVRSA